MKKLLLLLALVLSCGLASFAETFVDEIPNPTASKTYGAFTITGPQSGIEYKFDASQQSGFFQIRNSKSSYITNNTECGAIKVIQFKLNEAKKVNVYGSNEKFGSYSATPTNGILIGSASTTGVNTINVTDSYKYIYFVADGTAIVKICDIKLTWEVNGTDPTKTPAGIEYKTTEFNVELGNEFTAPELVNPNDLAVTYTSSDESVATVAADGSVEILAAGTTTITATSAETETYQKGEASYKLTVTRPIPEGAIIEELDAADFGIEKEYKNYTWVSPVTNIEYVAHAYSETGEYFQQRTSKSESGIVVTKNDGGYLLSEIRVEWVVPGMAGTTLDVYVNDEAYSAPSALFSSATQGNKVGSIVKAENAPLSLNADKKFVGIRSNNGAVQLSKITLVWEKPAAPVAPAAPVVTMGEKTVTVTVEEGCTAYYKFVVVNDQPAIETFALEADTWYPVENNTIDLTKLPMTSGNEKLQITVKAVNADNVESEVYTTEPFANPGGTTGIADIELGEEAPAEYYNLQGVRMEGELTPGLYIRRQGNKATKVIVK